MKKNVLVLYTEYAPYLHACFLKFTRLFNYDVHVVRYPLDKNAPFQFSEAPGIRFYERREMDRNAILDLCRKLDPVCILVAGWIDRDYNAILPELKKEGRLVITAVDNQWVGSLKQKLFALGGRFFVQKRYSSVWVPGIFQYEYMRKSGIPSEMVMTGYYCADSDLYQNQYRQRDRFPKRFIYVGRLLEFKGMATLIEAIEMTNASGQHNWEFVIIGSGDYEEKVRALSQKYSNITYKPFMQPDELARETAGGGVFVLPSNYEAWGVVVHEYALMGFPLILSSMVGARNQFLSPGYNGFVFKAGDSRSLKSAFDRFISMDEDSLKAMAQRSHEIGKTLNTEAWACRLNERIISHINS